MHDDVSGVQQRWHVVHPPQRDPVTVRVQAPLQSAVTPTDGDRGRLATARYLPHRATNVADTPETGNHERYRTVDAQPEPAARCRTRRRRCRAARRVAGRVAFTRPATTPVTAVPDAVLRPVLVVVAERAW